MISEKNIPFQKIVLKRDPLQFTLYGYLHEAAGDHLSQDQKNEIEEKLVQFARKTWRYKRICDFRIDQMAYTQRGQWVLIDMSDSSSEMPQDLLFKMKDKGNAFSPVPYMTEDLHNKLAYSNVVPKALYAKIDEAVQAERKFQRKNFQWLKRDRYDEHSLINRLTLDPVPEGTTLVREPICMTSQFVIGKPCPMTDEVKMTILKHLSDEKSFGVYSVKLPSGESAVLKLMKDQEPGTLKVLRKAIKKSTQQGSLIESGNDFVLQKP
jgi:hypothetical protein